jgi:hypothetical protein
MFFSNWLFTELKDSTENSGQKNSGRTFQPNIPTKHSNQTFQPNIPAKHSNQTFRPNIPTKAVS